VTCNRSPEVSSIAFHAQPPDLPPVPLMDVGFAITCPLARHRRPQIQFLSIVSRVCSTLLSDLASRLSPCASLLLRLHQAVKRTFTSKLSNMLGTHAKRPASSSCRAFPAIGVEFDYVKRSEKSVNVRNVESICSTSFPFASDFCFTLIQSGSAWKAFQFAAAASRLGCRKI
jgi:hypothetical protein